MTDPSIVSEQHLLRQVIWLRDSWTWLLQTKVLGAETDMGRMKALDVGCGPGLVMEELRSLFDVEGLDRDKEMVRRCRAKGLKAVVGRAEELPFQDGSFDVVYCSFLLLWVGDASKVAREMIRVSRRWVVCLAEPDYGGRIDHPEELGPLKELLIEGLKRSGADPLMGRKLRGVFNRAGLEVEVGVHPGLWSSERLALEAADEWRNIAQISGSGLNDMELQHLKSVWESGLVDGTRFQFSPMFYLFGRK